jgi:hypothetical protein
MSKRPKTRIEEIGARWRLMPEFTRKDSAAGSTLRAVKDSPATVEVSGFGSANIADAIEMARRDIAWLTGRLDEFVERYGREHFEAMQAEREARARVESEDATTIGALQAEIAANKEAMERLIGEAIAAGAERDTERERAALYERLAVEAEAEAERLREALEGARAALREIDRSGAYPGSSTLIGVALLAADQALGE